MKILRPLGSSAGLTKKNNVHFVGRIILSLLVLVPALSLPAFAAPEAPARGSDEKVFDTFTFYWENDTFAGTDRDYSNGLKFTWSTPYDIGNGNAHLPEWTHPVFNNLPFFKDPKNLRAFSISFGQMIFTPEDTFESDIVVDDRPYAGYLYLAGGFHNSDANRKDSWEFQLGIVGPLAFGRETQNIFHDLFNNSRAAGWEHQLGNEPALEIIYESQWRLEGSSSRKGLSYDFIPHLGLRLGNVQIYANAGAEIRYGWNLPKDFGSCPIRAGCSSNSAFNDSSLIETRNGFNGWRLFVAVDGRMVAHDIFLDGNTFRDSHSVDREIFVADMMTGLAFDFGNFNITYSYVIQSKQFSEDTENHLFGSLSCSLRY